MSAESHLRVVDTATGEIREECESCKMLRVQLEGAEKDIRAWRARYNALAREEEENIREHPAYGDMAILFKHWKAVCRHPKSRLDVKRFRLALPFLENDGLGLCRRAVDGAAYDPYVTARKNGSKQRHDGWDLIFKGRKQFEEFCNRAPREQPPGQTPPRHP